MRYTYFGHIGALCTYFYLIKLLSNTHVTNKYVMLSALYTPIV